MRRGHARAGHACVLAAPDRLAVPWSYLRGTAGLSGAASFTP